MRKFISYLIISLIFSFGAYSQVPSDWSSSTTYSSGALVISNGTTYIAQRDIETPGIPLSNNNYWLSLDDAAPSSAPSTTASTSNSDLSTVPTSSPEENSETPTLNFYHGFKHLEGSGAGQYLLDQATIKKYSEWQSPPLTYFGPSANDELSTLTYKYSFDGAVQSARVRISLSVWNFNVSGAYGSGSGEASAWASKDGSNWVNLIDLPTPTTSFSDGKTFEDMLPSSVLGASNLYLQIRMKVSGAPNSSYTTAQFGRSDANANKDIFYLDANYSSDLPSPTMPSPWFVQSQDLDFRSAQDIEVSSNDQFTIVGSIGSGGYAKSFDSEQSVKWTFSTSKTNQTFLKGVSSDSYGNFYLCGHLGADDNWGGLTVSHNYERDPWVGKVDASGNWLWVKPIATSAWSGADAVYTDSSGNSFITGYIYGTTGIGTQNVGGRGWYDAFLAKIDADGNWQWAVSGGSNSGDFGKAITVDSSGNIYWAGNFRNTASFGNISLTSRGGGTVDGGGDIFIAKLDSSGNFLWAKRAGSNNENSTYEGTTLALTTDSQDNVYLSGNISGNSDFGDISTDSRGGRDGFLAKLNPSGDWQWVRIVGGSGDESISALEYLNDNTLVVAGSFSNNITLSNGTTLSPSANSDSYILTYNTSGELLDFDTLNNSGSINISSSTVNSDGNIIFGGTFTGDFNYANQTHQSANSGADKSVFALFYPLQGESIDLTSGLVAWYPFDGNASDMSGNGNDGILKGSNPRFTSTSSNESALVLDENSWAQVSHSDAINPQGSRTISFLFSSNKNCRIFSNRRELPYFGRNWDLGYHDSTFQFTLFRGWNEYAFIDLPNHEMGKMYHVSFTLDSEKGALIGFVNGSKIEDATVTFRNVDEESFVNWSNNQGSVPLDFGREDGYNGTIAEGIIDEVRFYNRALSEAEVLALYELEKPKIDLTRGLVAWYPLDGNASDMSGNGNDGTVYGATLGEDRNGEAGKAYEFDGVDDYIEVLHDPLIDFDVSEPHTLSLWIKLENDSPSGAILGKWSNSYDPYPYCLRFSSDNFGISANIYTGGYPQNSSNAFGTGYVTIPEQINEHIQICAVFYPDLLELYTQGKLLVSRKSELISDFSSNTHSLFIGKWGGRSDRNFKGTIDDVRIYNRALSEAEVQALYELEKPKFNMAECMQHLPTGSLIAIPVGTSAPSGLSLVQDGEPGGFDLYQVDGPVPVNNSFAVGVSEVIKNPFKFGLFTQEDINSTRDTAKKEGEGIGKSLGEYSVVNNPTGYGLVSSENHLSILAETNASARSVGAELGRNEILADPYSYNLVTKLEYDQMAESLRMPDTNATPYTDGWFYIPDRGWMWAITKTYPWFYDSNTSNWVYFKQGGALPRYYNYTTTKWMEWPDFVKKPWDTHYEEWLQNPEPYGGANVLGIIKSAKDEHKTKLDLGDYHVKDLAPLSGLKHLTALNIGDNDITDISVLSQMDGLTRLVLKDNKNLVDLHPLADLSKLEELDLMYNDLSQLDLTPLYQLSNLRILRVSDYLVSFSQMNALQEKLPNCQILFVEAEDFDWDN